MIYWRCPQSSPTKLDLNMIPFRSDSYREKSLDFETMKIPFSSYLIPPFLFLINHYIIKFKEVVYRFPPTLGAADFGCLEALVLGALGCGATLAFFSVTFAFLASFATLELN